MAYTPVNRILLGAVAPVVMYYVGLKAGFPLIGAATAALWGVGVFAWHLYSAHEIDGFSGIGAAYVMAELVGLAVTRDPDWFLVSPIVSDGILGCVLLLSILLKKPLIHLLAGQSVGPAAFPDEVRSSAGFQRVWTRLSLVWGGAYVIKGALKLAALHSLPTEGYLAVRAGLGWPVVMGLIGFSFWYPRRCWRESK